MTAGPFRMYGKDEAMRVAMVRGDEACVGGQRARTMNQSRGDTSHG